jgi:hypothetical protein
MAGVRDPLVLLPLPCAATPPRAFLDFLHPCESKNAVGGVAGSCLDFAGGCMGGPIILLTPTPQLAESVYNALCSLPRNLHARARAAALGSASAAKGPRQDTPRLRQVAHINMHETSSDDNRTWCTFFEYSAQSVPVHGCGTIDETSCRCFFYDTIILIRRPMRSTPERGACDECDARGGAAGEATCRSTASPQG